MIQKQGIRVFALIFAKLDLLINKRNNPKRKSYSVTAFHTTFLRGKKKSPFLNPKKLYSPINN